MYQVAYRYRGAPLSVVTSGTQHVDSSRLARSERLASSIEEMRSMGAFVVLDLPAGLRSSNAAVVGSKCDGVIIVVRSGRTRKGELARLLRLMQDVNVIGVVINRQHTNVPAWAERLLGLPA
jgi:Mrp family chromosome partitioning ATPase